MTRATSRGRSHESEGGRAVILIVLVMLMMGLGGWVAAYAGANGKVPRGTHVAGVEIGGLSRAEAIGALARGLQARGEKPIVVTAGTVTLEVAPRDAGLFIDPTATVDQVLGNRSWDPRALWHYYTGGDEITPAIRVNHADLDEALEAIDEQAGQPARNAGISLAGGQITLTEPQNGARLDIDRSREVMVAAYTAGQTSVRLPLVLEAPQLDEDDLRHALETIANPALSAPVTLKFAGSDVVLQPRQYADLLSIVDQDGTLALDVDSAGLAALVDPTARETQPVDATVTFADGAPTVVKAVAGRTYDEAGVTAAFLRAVTADGPARTVLVEGTRVKAAFTTKAAKTLGVVTTVSSFSVPVPATAGPSFADAVARLSGTLVRPGETFSFNGTVGTVNGSGPRLATATWNAGFLAGLTDVARAASPAFSTGLPEGRDALVGAGADLQMRNDTGFGVLFAAYFSPGAAGTPGTVRVDVWSTKQFEVNASTSDRYNVTPRTTVVDPDPACVPSPGADGFSVDLVRTVTRVGNLAPVRSDTVTSTYQPMPEVVCQSVARPGP